MKEKNVNKQVKIRSISPLIKLMKEAKVPWISYLFFFLLNLFVTERAVRLSVIAGQFMDPEFAEHAIQDSSLILEFALSSLAIALIGFLVIPISWVSIQFQKRAQIVSWRHILRLSVGRIDSLDPASLVSRVSTDSAFVSEVLATVLNFFRNGYWLYLSITTLFATDSWMATRIIPSVALSVIVTMFASKFIYKLHYRKQQVESKLTAFLNERFSALRTIKSEQTEALEIYNGSNINRDKFKAEVGIITYDTFYTGYQSFIMVLLQILVIVSGAIRIANGDMQIGGLVTIFFLAQQFPGTTQSFFSSILTLIRIQGQTQVVAELTQSEGEKYMSERSLDSALLDKNINLENVNFSYSDSKKILTDLSAEFKAGKVNAIVGPSGAGKTTILKLLERFYSLDSGRISLDNEDIDKYHLKEWRDNCSYIIQNSPLMPGTILDNIMYGLRSDISTVSYTDTSSLSDELKARLDEVLKISKLDEVIEKLPQGLGTDVGDLSDKISGGQRQRIAIARALISDPDLLLMDEATANIDSENERLITEAILKDREGRTTIIVAHQLATILSAEQILLVDNGKLKASGTHDSLYSNSSLYKELFDLQKLV